MGRSYRLPIGQGPNGTINKQGLQACRAASLGLIVQHRECANC
jgi:hypothetical protein